MTKGDTRDFTTLPARVIADTELTALDIRCLAVISLHDGMSAKLGKGGGCYARNDTLAALAQTDTTRFSKCLTKLIRAGYVSREPQIMDKRRFTLRVQFGAGDSWRTGQQTGGKIVGELANNPPEIVDQGANRSPGVVDRDENRNGSFSKETGRHYISLNEEIDFVKTRERNSTKWPHEGFPNPFQGKDTAKAGCASVSLKAQMSPSFDALDSAAQVGQIQRAFSMMDCDASRIRRKEREELSSLLYAIFDCHSEESFGQQAHRLYEEIAPH